MRNKILTLSLGVLVALLISCDDRFIFVEDINNAPKIYFGDIESNVLLQSSLKTGGSIKYTMVPYAFALTVTDFEKNVKSITYTVSGGTADIIKSNAVLAGSVAYEKDGSIPLAFAPKEKTGSYTIDFVVTDQFDATSTCQLKLDVFTNKLPVARLTISDTPIFSPYQKELDASLSIDGDADFGGSIVLYEYTITSKDGVVKLLNNQAKSPFIFPGPGGYDITLKVTDNEGATASVAMPTVNIN